MNKNFSSTNFFLISFFVLIFPFIQKQWFNLYLFNINSSSFYSIIYYLSGIICPVIFAFNSLNHFTYYKFNSLINKEKKIISGKKLFVLVLLILISLSFLIVNYFLVNIELAIKLFHNQSFLIRVKVDHEIYILFIVSLFLILNKTKILIKKLILFNFILTAFFIWYAQINNNIVDGNYLINKYLITGNPNFVNLAFLFLFEIKFFLWSFLSNKNNLSDWIVPKPLKKDYLNLLRIIIFYFLLLVYYFLIGQ